MSVLHDTATRRVLKTMAPRAKTESERIARLMKTISKQDIRKLYEQLEPPRCPECSRLRILIDELRKQTFHNEP